jgi:hypothetical protein
MLQKPAPLKDGEPDQIPNLYYYELIKAYAKTAVIAISRVPGLFATLAAATVI